MRKSWPADAKPLDTLLQETASQTLDKLFGKHVPLAVQNFLDRKNGLPQRKEGAWIWFGSL